MEQLRAAIQLRHNEVIAFNEDLRETALRQTEKEILQLTNEVFALQNKLENIAASQLTGQQRQNEIRTQIEQTIQSVANVRGELSNLTGLLQENTQQLQFAEEAFRLGRLLTRKPYVSSMSLTWVFPGSKVKLLLFARSLISRIASFRIYKFKLQIALHKCKIP